MPEKMGEVVDALRSAGSVAPLRALLDSLVTRHALAWGPAIVHAEQPEEAAADAPPVQVNWSEATLEVPLAGRFLAPLTAVMRHVASVTLHTVWDAADYRTPGQGGEFYRAMSDFVTSRALRFGLSLPRTAHCRVGFATSSAVLADRGQVLPLIAQVQVFATHLDELGRALLHSPYQLSPLTSPLDAGEVEVLQGLLAGRSTADLGLALRMSQPAVRKRATSAAEKLGCVGAHQAAARALHMGWLAA